MLDLNYLCKMSYENAKRRAEHEPTVRVDVRNTLKHCAGEVVESAEAYNSMVDGVANKEIFADELADIICCVLTICGHEDIDIELALTKCMEKNFKRGHTNETC